MSTPRAIANDSSTSTSQVKIHALQTGVVRVRSKQIQGEGQGARRLLRTFLDREWSDWLPIYAWAIEHPEGVILVDTGETSRTSDPDYLPAWHPYYRSGVKFQVDPDDEIGPQLLDRWIEPGNVKTVIMTHLHTDHAGGLHHFPTSEILVHEDAYRAAQGVTGRARGFLPHRWPEWFSPKRFEFNEMPFGPFPQSFPVTETGDVVLVPTPGHTPHHLSVVVRTDERLYFLAGDSSYTQDLMLTGQIDGVASNDEIARDTLSRIRELASRDPVIYLPSHDPDAARRLRQNEAVSAGNRDLSVADTAPIGSRAIPENPERVQPVRYSASR